jgi:hypothetical protein
VLIDCHHCEVGSSRLLPLAHTRILTPNAHLDLHRRSPGLSHYRRQRNQIPDVDRSEESEGIDFHCDYATVGMAHRSDPSRGIDELHYLATVYESCRVCMS